MLLILIMLTVAPPPAYGPEGARERSLPVASAPFPSCGQPGGPCRSALENLLQARTEGYGGL